MAEKTPARSEKPALLADDNPQIAKGCGDAPLQAYIAAMPGWKRGLGRRPGALVERPVPGVAFFRGAALADPAGLFEGAGKRMRHVKLRPGQALDADALGALIDAAYRDIRRRLGLG